MLKFIAQFFEQDQQLDAALSETPQQLTAEFSDEGSSSGVPLTPENIQAVLGYTPADQADLADHMRDTVAHVTAAEKKTWNNKSDFSGKYSDLSGKPTIPEKLGQLEDDIGVAKQEVVGILFGSCVRTINYTRPDAAGNINVDGGSGLESGAFELAPGDTLMWNGNEEGRVVVDTYLEAIGVYWVHVSNVVPTFEELQAGGLWGYLENDGEQIEEAYPGSEITDYGETIRGAWSEFYIAKQDNAHHVEDDGFEMTLPKRGIYFLVNPDDGYCNKISIEGFQGFSKTVLRPESLTDHGHDWYGKVIKGGNTAVGDCVVSNTYLKVSDSMPTETEVRKGGVVRHYDVQNNAISGDMIIANYLGAEYNIIVNKYGLQIWYKNVFLLVYVSYDGGPMNGGITLHGMNGPGVYLAQTGTACVHSLTINDYKGFAHNVEKIPAELLPSSIGSGSGSGNLLIRATLTEATDESSFTFSADKTYAEIVAAVESGIFAYMTVDLTQIGENGSIFLPLWGITNDNIVFRAPLSTKSMCVATINSANVGTAAIGDV